MERKETVARWLKTNPEYVDSFSDFKGTVDEYFDKWNKDWQFHWHENKDKEPYPFIKKWIGSDREEKWLKLQQSNEPSLQDTIKYYQNNEIEYRLNVHGLRDEPWENKPEEVDVYLGDSNTLGTGIIRDDAYPYLISKQLDFPSLYCGAGAADITTQFNLLIFISKKFKIRNLFHNPVKKFVSIGWKIGSETLQVLLNGIEIFSRKDLKSLRIYLILLILASFTIWLTMHLLACVKKKISTTYIVIGKCLMVR